MTVFHRDSVTITIRYRRYPKRRKTNIFFSLQKYSKWDTKHFFLFFLEKKLFSKRLQVYKKTTTFAPAIERDAALQTVLLTWWNKRGRFSLIVICTWYLTLAGLRERERIRPREDGWSAFYGSFEKKLFQKKLSKTFGGYDKISYLCIRFRKRWQTGIRVLWKI